MRHASWVILGVAGLLEIGWAIGLEYTAGFTKLGPSALTIAAMAASVYLLSIAAKSMPIGTAYAVWSGIGAAGAALIGIMVLHEPATLPRVFCIALILAGVIGLKLATPA